MSATSTRPAYAAAGETRWATLRRWNVTVRSAFTASPGTSPLDAATPDGTSTLRVGTPWRFMASTAARAFERMSPSKPVPRTASTPASAPRPSPSVAEPELDASAEVHLRVALEPLDICVQDELDTSSLAQKVCRAATKPSPAVGATAAMHCPGPVREETRPRLLRHTHGRPAPSGQVTGPGMRPRRSASHRRSGSPRASSHRVLNDADRARQLARVRHREVDHARMNALGKRERATGTAWPTAWDARRSPLRPR